MARSATTCLCFPMNSAFKIGVFAYFCTKNLPHPGIVVLDSRTSVTEFAYLEARRALAGRRGTEDHGLKDYRYKHVVELSRDSQFTNTENDSPPTDVYPFAAVTTFGGETASSVVVACSECISRL
jgi:hypothetical protein